MNLLINSGFIDLETCRMLRLIPKINDLIESLQEREKRTFEVKMLKLLENCSKKLREQFEHLLVDVSMIGKISEVLSILDG